MPKKIEAKLTKYAKRKYPGSSPAAKARRNNYVYGTLTKKFGFVKGTKRRKARGKRRRK